MGKKGKSALAKVKQTSSKPSSTVSQENGESSQSTVTVSLPTEQNAVVVSAPPPPAENINDAVQVVSDSALPSSTTTDLEQVATSAVSTSEEPIVVAVIPPLPDALVENLPTLQTTDQQTQPIFLLDESQPSLSDVADMTSSSSSSSTQTASILEQLGSARAETQPAPRAARFINPSFETIESIISNKNAAEFDEETLKRVRETASRGFDCALMEQKLQRDFPELFSFTKEYTEEEKLQYQPSVMKIQRLAIFSALTRYIRNSDETKRELIINLIHANEIEAFCSLLQNNRDELGNFNILVDNPLNTAYSLKMVSKKLHKEIRQKATLELIFRSLTNLELMKQTNNMMVLLFLVGRHLSHGKLEAVDCFVYFKKQAAQLGLGDLGSFKAFNKEPDYVSFQSHLEFCYENLLQRRKEQFISMAASLLDVRFMQIDKIQLLIDLVSEDKTPGQCYEALKQCAPALNMPGFPDMFNNAVDEEEFVFIQQTLRNDYIKLRYERKQQIKSLCAKCSDTNIMAKGQNKTRLNLFVCRDTPLETCHARFKEFAYKFEINNFSDVFDSMIDEEEKQFLQDQLRYQKMVLSVKEKCAFSQASLKKQDVLRLEIIALDLEESQTVGMDLGITEFDLLPEWEAKAKLLAYRGLAIATMKFRDCSLDTQAKVLEQLTTIERCKQVQQHVFLEGKTSSRRGFCFNEILYGTTGSESRWKAPIRETRATQTSTLSDSPYALQTSSSSSSLSSTPRQAINQ